MDVLGQGRHGPVPPTGASIEDKRAAVKHLVDVLERIRPDVKREMLNKDEGALFDLANNFALRHYGRGQKGD